MAEVKGQSDILAEDEKAAAEITSSPTESIGVEEAQVNSSAASDNAPNYLTGWRLHVVTAALVSPGHYCESH